MIFRSSFRALIVLLSFSVMYPHLVAAQSAPATQIVVKWQGSISFAASSPEAAAVVTAASASANATPVGGRLLATGGETIKLDQQLSPTQVKAFVETIRGSGLTLYVEEDLPLQVFTSDIADAAIWSAGGEVPGTGENPQASRTLDVPFSAAVACPQTLRDAFEKVTALGAIVFAGVRSDAADIETASASCPGVQPLPNAGDKLDNSKLDKSVEDIGIAFVPPAPRWIFATPAGSTDGNYTVSWERSPLATTHYELQRHFDGNWRETRFVTGTSFRFTNQASRHYEHRVRACNSEGCSEWVGFAPVDVRR
jgi:hypothetical protein